MDSHWSSKAPVQDTQDYSHSNSPSLRQSLAPSYPAFHRQPPSSNPPALPPINSSGTHLTQKAYEDYGRRWKDAPSWSGPTSTPPAPPGSFSSSYAPSTATQYPSHPTYPTPPRPPLQPASSYNSQLWSSQTSAPQGYSSQPSSAANPTLPNLLPALNNHGSQQSFYPQHNLPGGNGHQYEAQQMQPHSVRPSQTSFHPMPQQQNQAQPTHVVGAQGRRGILPSAAGRPAAVANGAQGSQKTAAAPAKDAEGKFPCEHCNKNYLHAKHLKRHLLRRKYHGFMVEKPR